MSETSPKAHGQCYCGNVQVTVTGPAAVSGYCHCLECRKWHGAPINAFSVWPSTSVTIEGETLISEQSDASGRLSCRLCGGCVANLKPALKMTVVYPMTLAGAEDPLSFEPSFHIFYGERVMDLADGLPKFVALPPDFGGTGETVTEAGHTGWRA